jgi:hypothetical protein
MSSEDDFRSIYSLTVSRIVAYSFGAGLTKMKCKRSKIERSQVFPKYK